jgi:hypothetical protein
MSNKERVMKNILKTTIASILALLISLPVWAVSDNECAIWLCAPAGFPSGCGAAKSAMLKRIKRLKPPLPNLNDCAKKNKNQENLHPDFRVLNYKHGFAALMPAYSTCSKYHENSGNCIGTITKYPMKYSKGSRCEKYSDTWQPHGCLKTARYVEVFKYSKLIGKTYYW